MTIALDPTAQHQLIAVFDALGVPAEVHHDGSVQFTQEASEMLAIQLQRVAAARSVAFGSLDEIVSVLNGGAATTHDAPLELLGAVGAVPLDGGINIPPHAVLGVVIGLDLAARLDSLLDDRAPEDAAEELRFLITAAERHDVAELGEYVRDAAGVLGA